MNQPQPKSNAPPKLIHAFAAGFNTVTNHVYLLAFPIAIDLLLWFGPRLRLRELFLPIMDDANRALLEMNSTDLAARMETVYQIWGEILEGFNLVSFLRTFPIGVPSLMASQSSLDTPLGTAPVIEIKSILPALGLMAVILTIGFILGCLYFSLLARCTAEGNITITFKHFTHQVGQILLMTVGLVLLLMLLSLPGLLLLSVFAVINPNLANIALMVALLILVWLLVPLVFTPHGIFSGQKNLLASIATSVRLVRFYLPSTGIFLLIALIIAQGLDILWQVPPATSWLTAVGIFGHAFIYTGLFAASFDYFRGGMRLMIQNIARESPREINI